MATNQGESSTQDNEVKKPVMMPTPDNIEGNESGVSTTAGLGAVPANYVPPSGNTGINGTYDTADLSAKWQNREQDIPEAGKNQYQ